MSERATQTTPTPDVTAPVAADPARTAGVRVTGTRGPLVQRRCACGGTPGPSGECAECRKKRLQLQRRLADDVAVPRPAAPQSAPDSVHRALATPGKPLEPSTRGLMESRLGHDLGRVRVHADGLAAASAAAVDARAYTVGDQVVFGQGEFAPQTPAGMRLLAHELTHTLQQRGAASGALQRELAIGSADDPAEREAERIASRVMQGLGPTAVTAAPPLLRRAPTTPQPRGGESRMAVLDQPPRGEDEVKVRILRYLCDCRGVNVTRTSVLTRTSPNPGITLKYCRGRTTLAVTGDVVPSGFTSGTVRAGVVFNYAPTRGSTGVRVQVEGQARNTGDEPQVGGRGEVTVQTPEGSPNVGVSGEILQGTQSGQVDSSVNAEVQVSPNVTIFGGVTNPQDERRGGQIGIRGRFGSTPVEREVCRECRCPVVYDCFEDIPPRRFEEETEFEVEDETRLRYYFRLNSNRDARDANLRAESTRSLDRLEQLVADGAAIVSIAGHASPEADQETLNAELSLTRGERFRELIAARLGQDVELPEATAGGELLGSNATILPGSGLSDAILGAGFDGPEEVSAFLIGEEIENDQLADQFLALLNRVTERDERLRLFGVAPASPIADQLIAAIEAFIAGGGRGPRPWDRIFEFLRVATVTVSQTRTETVTETRSTRGSIRQLGEAPCNRFAQEAENQNLFGPAEAPPSEAECPTGEPINRPGVGDDCDYSE